MALAASLGGQTLPSDLSQRWCLSPHPYSSDISALPTRLPARPTLAGALRCPPLRCECPGASWRQPSGHTWCEWRNTREQAEPVWEGVFGSGREGGLCGRLLMRAAVEWMLFLPSSLTLCLEQLLARGVLADRACPHVLVRMRCCAVLCHAVLRCAVCVPCRAALPAAPQGRTPPWLRPLRPPPSRTPFLSSHQHPAVSICHPICNAGYSCSSSTSGLSVRWLRVGCRSLHLSSCASAHRTALASNRPRAPPALPLCPRPPSPSALPLFAALFQLIAAVCRDDTMASAVGSFFLLIFINMTGGCRCGLDAIQALSWCEAFM